MKHTIWSEKIEYKFEFEICDSWLPHIRSLRLRSDIEEWIDHNIDRDNLYYVFDQSVLKYIAFKNRDDLLLFTMVWT